MTLEFSSKQQIVEQTRGSALAAVSTLVADYRGLSVAQATALREQARAQGVQLQVVRNTLARLALKDTKHECLVDSIVGPTMLAFSPADPGAAARLLKETIAKGTNLEVRAISVDGTLKEGQHLNQVAALPTKDEAIAKLMSVMLGPITKLAQILQAVPAKLVRTVDAVRVQKESG